MKTKIVGQDTDGIVEDVYKKEMEDYLGVAREIMTHSI